MNELIIRLDSRYGQYFWGGMEFIFYLVFFTAYSIFVAFKGYTHNYELVAGYVISPLFSSLALGYMYYKYTGIVFSLGNTLFISIIAVASHLAFLLASLWVLVLFVSFYSYIFAAMLIAVSNSLFVFFALVFFSKFVIPRIRAE
jgi:hypothetical protein